MPPAAVILVLIRRILCVVNQDVGVLSVIAKNGIEAGISALEIGCIDHRSPRTFNSIADGALRVSNGERLDCEPIAYHRFRTQMHESPADRDGLEVDREERVHHLPFERLLKIIRCGEGVESDFVPGFIKRGKKWDALDVVPVTVRGKKVNTQLFIFKLVQ